MDENVLLLNILVETMIDSKVRGSPSIRLKKKEMNTFIQQNDALN